MKSPIDLSSAWVNESALIVDFPAHEHPDDEWWRANGYKPLCEISKETLVAMINQLQDFRDPLTEELINYRTVPKEQLELPDEPIEESNNYGVSPVWSLHSFNSPLKNVQPYSAEQVANWMLSGKEWQEPSQEKPRTDE